MATNTFSLDISRWCAKANGNINLVVRKIALELFTRVILKSPVDTGRFRGNWQVAIGSIPAGTLQLNDKDGSATISRITAGTVGVKGGDIINLVNNLPYAIGLEWGNSKQAPNGMVRLTIQEFSAVVSKAANEVPK